MTIRRRQRRMQIEGISGTATRAIYDVSQPFPMIEFTIATKHDDPMSVSITLTLEEATKLTQQALNAISAATPKMPRMAQNFPWQG